MLLVLVRLLRLLQWEFFDHALYALQFCETESVVHVRRVPRRPADDTLSLRNERSYGVTEVTHAISDRVQHM